MISAHTCAVLSQLVYEDNGDRLRRRLDEIGFGLYGFYDQGGTQAILVFQDGTHVVAWRGTEESADWRADSRYVKTDFPAGGRVHLGFLEAFDQVRDEIGEDLAAFEGRGDCRVFCGHSLGAALATLGTVVWRPDLSYVYGSPRVGNGDFVRLIPRRRLVRHQNWFDPITKVPWGTSPVQAVHALRQGRAPTIYRHAGTRVRTRGFGHPIARYVKATTYLH